MLTPEDLIKITRGKAPWPYTPLELVRSRVTHAYPWMTALIARLEVIEDLTIPLAATDGRRMWVNTPVVEKKGDLGFAFFHEILHCVFGHCLPGVLGGRNRHLANIAMDFVVNLIAKDEGFAVPPGEYFIDEQFRNMSWYEVYEIISRDPAYSRMEVDFDVIEGDAATEAAHPAWQQAAIQAAEAKRAAGQRPGGMEERVRSDLAPEADYRDMLSRYLSAVVPSDTSWRRPNKRYVAQDMYLPGRGKSDAIAHVVIAIDTSGSVSSNLLARFVSQVPHVLSAYSVERLTVLFFDYGIQRVDDNVNASDIHRLESVPGRGGTNFGPVFEWANGEEPPSVVIVLTDWGAPLPSSARSAEYPIVWMVPKGAKNEDYSPVYGSVIEVGPE